MDHSPLTDGRPGWFRGAIALVLAGGLGLGLARAADWPQFLGPQRNGVSVETGLAVAWPAAGPPRVWAREVGAGFSGPVVAGGRLILFHRLGDDEVVECLDARTGKGHWKFAYPTHYQDDFGFDEGPRATPLVAGGRVYTLGAEGRLHCLELADGRKVWERAPAADFDAPKGFFGVATSPLLEGDLLLVNVGGKGGAGIVAFDRETGKTAWKATKDQASYSSPVSATFHGKREVIFFTREGIVFLDPRTGAVRYRKHWRSRLQASVNAASPVVAGDYVYISACYGTGAILLHVGEGSVEEVWKSDEIMSNHYTTCVYHDGHLYGFDGRQEEGARLRCVELKTGKVCWTSEHAGCGSMVLADGNLIVLGEESDLFLVEATPEAYREKARATVLSKPCRSPVALADGYLYARDGKRLVCWDLRRK